MNISEQERGAGGQLLFWGGVWRKFWDMCMWAGALFHPPGAPTVIFSSPCPRCFCITTTFPFTKEGESEWTLGTARCIFLTPISPPPFSFLALYDKKAYLLARCWPSGLLCCISSLPIQKRHKVWWSTQGLGKQNLDCICRSRIKDCAW